MRASPQRISRRRHGFTLLELALVMALIGLASAMVLPDFWRWARGTASHGELELVVAELQGLGFRVWSTGRPLVLTSANAREVLHNLPPAWRAVVAEPVRFAPSGACTGGQVTLVAPDGTQHVFRLVALVCDVERG